MSLIFHSPSSWHKGSLWSHPAPAAGGVTAERLGLKDSAQSCLSLWICLSGPSEMKILNVKKKKLDAKERKHSITCIGLYQESLWQSWWIFVWYALQQIVKCVFWATWESFAATQFGPQRRGHLRTCSCHSLHASDSGLSDIMCRITCRSHQCFVLHFSPPHLVLEWQLPFMSGQQIGVVVGTDNDLITGSLRLLLWNGLLMICMLHWIWGEKAKTVFYSQYRVQRQCHQKSWLLLWGTSPHDGSMTGSDGNLATWAVVLSSFVSLVR